MPLYTSDDSAALVVIDRVAAREEIGLGEALVSVSLVETATLRVFTGTIVSADTVALSIVESGTQSAGGEYARADSATVGLSETLSILETGYGEPIAQIGLHDQVGGLSIVGDTATLITRSDALTIGTVEVGTASSPSGLTRTDAVGAVLADDVYPTFIQWDDTANQIIIGLVEAAQLARTQTVPSDALAVRMTEYGLLAIPLTSQDTLTIGTTETANIPINDAVPKFGYDTMALPAFDDIALWDVISLVDTQKIGLSDSVGSLAATVQSMEGAGLPLSLSDVLALLSLQFSIADGATLAFLDTGGLSPGASTLLSASDTLHVGLSDAAAALAVWAQADEVGRIGLTDAASIVCAVSAAGESVGLTCVDSLLLFALATGGTDAGSKMADAWQPLTDAHPSLDALALPITESRQSQATVQSVDPVIVALAELVSSVVLLQASDVVKAVVSDYASRGWSGTQGPVLVASVVSMNPSRTLSTSVSSYTAVESMPEYEVEVFDLAA